MASGDKNYDIAKESSQQIIIDNITAEVADKATLDNINTKIDTIDGIVDNIYAKVDTEVAAIKTVADNIYGKVDTEVAAINTLIGATNNIGGSATAGTVMAKLNALLGKTSAPTGYQVYDTAGTKTWTCPTGVHVVTCLVIGAGGGGGGGGGGTYYYSKGYYASGGGGGGGAAGEMRLATIPVIPGKSYRIVVGAAGTAGAGGAGSSTSSGTNGSAGGAGGDSEAFDFILAKGGLAGKAGGGGVISTTRCSYRSIAGAAGAASGSTHYSDYGVSIYGGISRDGNAGAAGKVGSGTGYVPVASATSLNGGAGGSGARCEYTQRDSVYNGSGGNGGAGGKSGNSGALTGSAGSAGAAGYPGYVLICW